jgi:K+-sensing histidine kinase KdpD
MFQAESNETSSGQESLPPEIPVDVLRGFLHSLAHDLRQPLSTVETCAYGLSTMLPDAPPRVYELLQIIFGAVEQGNRVLMEALASLDDLKSGLTYPEPALQQTATSGAQNVSPPG